MSSAEWGQSVLKQAARQIELRRVARFTAVRDPPERSKRAISANDDQDLRFMRV